MYNVHSSISRGHFGNLHREHGSFAVLLRTLGKCPEEPLRLTRKRIFTSQYTVDLVNTRVCHVQRSCWNKTDCLYVPCRRALLSGGSNFPTIFIFIFIAMFKFLFISIVDLSREKLFIPRFFVKYQRIFSIISMSVSRVASIYKFQTADRIRKKESSWSARS